MFTLLLEFSVLVATAGAPPSQSPSDSRSSLTADTEESLDPNHAARLAIGLKIFQRHVRPILVQHCLRCHGGESIEAELDLSDRKKLLHGGESGPAIVKGDSKASRLYQLVSHAQEPKMPMDANRLSDESIQGIADWIDHGAPYDGPLVENGSSPESWTDRKIADEARDFWSFRPLLDAEIPSIQDDGWCRTVVDRFVLQKLLEEGIEPQPSTDRLTLLRRLHLDLVGLPPTIEEQDAFLADTGSDCVEKVVDHLLASPRYGERWGRHWLDVARWGESHGFEHDYDRPTAYHYRDFVIKALNEDMPFDAFVRLQVAGDEVEGDHPLAWMATGFLAAGVHSTQITKNEVEKHRYDEMDDMLATIGTSMLGLTIGCARCHDHKYDPIPQADYYRLLSTFTSTVRSEREFDLEPEKYRKAKRAFDAEHDPLVAALDRYRRERIPERFEQWEKSRPPGDPVEWRVLDFEMASSEVGAEFSRREDGSYLVGGTNGKFDVYTLVAPTLAAGMTALRLEALADPALPKEGPGRAENGNFALTDIKVVVASTADGQPVPVKFTSAAATFEQKGLPIAAVIDDDDRSGWAVDPEFGKDHAALFRFEAPVGAPEGSKITVTLTFKGNSGHNIGRLRLSVATSTETLGLRAEGMPDALLAALHKPPGERSTEEIRRLHDWFRVMDPEWQELHRQVLEHAKNEPKPELTKVLVSGEGIPPLRLHSQGQDFFDQTYFLRRGETDNKEGVAPQGFLQVLMPKASSTSPWIVAPPAGSSSSYRRRSLANWLTDTEQGAGNLLARVIVNRLWHHHFGQGIVATPSDFGSRGAPPSHPELLDWLAGELIRNGWKLKSIHKLLLTSAVYSQRSRAEDAVRRADPENRLLSRWRSRRLEAEAIRDSLLFVSGTLDPGMFGPGTLETSSRRRSIYLTVKRSQLIPMMQVFDAPDALTGIADRPTTTVAPQALLLLNNPNIREQSRQWALHLDSDDTIPWSDVVVRAYRMALGRPPNPREASAAVAFLEDQFASHARENQERSRELAMTDFCQAIFCLNEFVYVD